MRYWIYTDNEVRGPFGARELASRPGFSGSSLVCPESSDGGQGAEWKEASNYPEIFAAPPAPAAPPAAAPRPAPAEDMLALTMRGSLVSEPVVDDRASAAPAAQGAPKVGDLVFSPPVKPSPSAASGNLSSVPLSPAGAAPATAPGRAADPRIEALRKKLDQMSSTLKTMGESQVQLTGRISMLESVIDDMKSLLAQELPGK
ncbi:MAG: hypothetical protein RDU13_10215 [Elusimicrobiales bacterium]|jgi:hypothetical protein|nr:hypothetical protein [Elusimicrobiales bacterium]